MHASSQSVNVKRVALLEILKANRAQHIQMYDRAVEGYKIEMVEVLEKALKEAKEGKMEFLSIGLAQPQNHRKEYDQVIDMMEMSVDEVINLDSHSFQCYVKDQWNWSSNVTALNSVYATKAMGARVAAGSAR